MKKTYLIIFIFLCIKNSNAQFYCDTNYFLNSKKISCLGFYDSVQKCWLQNSFYYNGKLSRVEKYNSAKFQYKNFESISYHENGNIAIKSSCKNGLFNQDYIENYFNGSVKIKGSFYNGFKTGLWTDYYENGNTKSISYYSLSSEDSIFNKEISYQNIDSFLHGYIFTEVGQVDSSLGQNLMFINITKRESLFLLSTPVGVWKEYNENGKLINTTNYNKKRRKKNI